MSRTTRVVHCPPESVFAVLASGWLFPSWVVGASRMRKVDADFPHVGSQLHHSFGLWPLVIDDRTTVLEWDPPHRMVFQAAGWPLGEARISIEVEQHARGARVRMHEAPVKGPGTLVPAPLMHVLLWYRNVEALRRLAHLSEAGAGGRALSPASLPTPADRAGLREKRHVLARLTTAIGAVAAAALAVRGVAGLVARARS